MWKQPSLGTQLHFIELQKSKYYNGYLEGKQPTSQALGRFEMGVALFQTNVGDENIVPLACTVFVGGSTLLLVVRYLLRGLLGQMSSVSVRGKHCLVTGGSSGIGKEVAKV